MVNDMRNFGYVLQVALQMAMALALGIAALAEKRFTKWAGWSGSSWAPPASSGAVRAQRHQHGLDDLVGGRRGAPAPRLEDRARPHPSGFPDGSPGVRAREPRCLREHAEDQDGEPDGVRARRPGRRGRRGPGDRGLTRRAPPAGTRSRSPPSSWRTPSSGSSSSGTVPATRSGGSRSRSRRSGASPRPWWRRPTPSWRTTRTRGSAALGVGPGLLPRGLPWFAAVMWLPLRFPDGLPATTRLGRFAERFTLVTTSVFSVVSLFSPTLTDLRVEHVDNPIGAPPSMAPVFDAAGRRRLAPGDRRRWVSPSRCWSRSTAGAARSAGSRPSSSAPRSSRRSRRWSPASRTPPARGCSPSARSRSRSPSASPSCSAGSTTSSSRSTAR